MPQIAPFLIATLAPLPIDLDGISVERARHLHGRLVVASFVSVKPMDWPDRLRRASGPWYWRSGSARRSA